VPNPGSHRCGLLCSDWRAYQTNNIEPTPAALRQLRGRVAGSISSAMYPVYVGLGRVLADVGYANEQYREPDKN